MSSASVDFKYAMDTSATGVGDPGDHTHWLHAVSFSWSSGGTGTTPATPYHHDIPAYPNGAPSMLKQIRDYNRIVAAEAGGVEAVMTEIGDVYGESVASDIAALCLVEGVPNEFGHALGQHLKIKREMQDVVGKVTP